MENKEMNNAYENTINSSTTPADGSGYQSSSTQAESQNIYSHGYPAVSSQSSSSAGADSSSIYSHSSYQTSRTAQNVKDTSYEGTDFTNQYTQSSPGSYQTPYHSVPYNVMAQQPEKKKKSGSGKTIALVAGTLAVALCVGIGGGIIGSRLSSQNGAAPVQTSQSSSTSSTDSKETKTDESESNENGGSLNITKASNTETKPTNIQEVTAKVKDSVVEITTETTEYDSFYGQYVSQAAGSGVIISEDGYLLTNNHVIDGATTITVRLTNSKTYDAKLIGKDAALDVALLKIEETGLTAATFGDSSTLNVGQDAIAIGNPLGRLGGTVTNGIISALDREIQLDGKTMNLLQTNAAINPGNSGGGLFDANGNLIGLVVAKSSSSGSGTSVEGLGFAIPVNDIVDVLDDLKTKGHVTGRGNLGINIVTINTENAMFMYRVEKMGVYVSAVTDGSAADKAGLKVGDMIVSFNDKEISEGSELTAAVSKLKAGTKVQIKIERDGKEQTIEATLGEKDSDETSTQESGRSTTNPYGGGYFFGNGSGSDDGGYFGMG